VFFTHEIRHGSAIFRFLRPSVSVLRGLRNSLDAQKQHLQNWCFVFSFFGLFFLKHKILRPNKKVEFGNHAYARFPGVSTRRE